MVRDPLQFWTRLLRLPNFAVVHCEEDSERRHYRFTIAPFQRMAVCPHCQTVSQEVHQTRTRESIKDLPISKYTVDLTVRVPQSQCERCACTFTPPIPFLAEGAHATERTLAHWYYDYLQRRQQASQPALKPIRHLGSN